MTFTMAQRGRQGPHFRATWVGGLVVGTALVLAGCGGAGSGAASPDASTPGTSGADPSVGQVEPEVTLRYANALLPDDPSSQAMHEFKRVAEELSGGRIAVEIFDSSQLGGVAELVDQARAGAISMTMPSSSFLQPTLPELSVLNLPYLMTSQEEAFALVDGEVGRRLDEALQEQDLKILGWHDAGFRHMFNNVRPISTPADLEGLKIRLQTDPIHIAAFEAFGSNPIALDYSELYGAVQQGVVDGFEGGLVGAMANNLHEVTEYVSLTGHAWTPLISIINLDQFNAMPADLQDIVLQASKAETEFQRQVQAEALTEVEDRYAEAGIPINEPTPEQIQEFVDLALPTHDQFLESIGEDLYEEALRTVEEAGS